MQSKSTSLWAVLGMALWLSGCAPKHEEAPPPERALLPLAVFFGNPDYGSPAPSPQRTRTAVLMPSQGPTPRRMNVFVREGEGPFVQVSRVTSRNVSEFGWFSEERLGYQVDALGDENQRLFAVDWDGGNALELTPAGLQGVHTEVLGREPGSRERWRVAIGPVFQPKDVYWIDVNTGAYGLKERNPGLVHHIVWSPDGHSTLALAIDGLEQALLFRQGEQGAYRKVCAVTYPEFLLPRSLSSNGRAATVLTNRGRDKAALVEFDPEQGSFGAVIKEDERLDVTDGDAATRPWGARKERPDEALDLQPGLAVTYTARDGLTIPAWLSLPAEPSLVRPAVILCHGAPETRAGSPFNREALFLADRGLVVLEPNFRGSKGYGLGFLKAGHGQWGRAMNEDLQDGAAWLADLGLADPRRIGIMGGSYGGYAALAGVALTPDTYACAVAQAGPADLLTFLAAPLCRANAPYWKLLMGDDPEGLRAVSPFHQAHRIKVPVLLAHGARDPRVPVAESERMAAALRARNHPVRQLLWPEEGHGFTQTENELEFYRAVETFFARHLGSRAGAVR